MTKDIIEQESLRLSSGIRNELHLYREGTFLRAYDWSAWLACRYLHEFKVNKRQFKGVDAPVAYIGFPDTCMSFLSCFWVRLEKRILDVWRYGGKFLSLQASNINSKNDVYI